MCLSFISTLSLTRARRYMKPHRPLVVAHRSHWWPSVILTGTTTWCRGIARLLSKMQLPAPVVRTNICASSPRRLFQRQRRRLTESLVGVGSPDTPWRGSLPCMPSTGQTCSPGWAACPAPSGSRHEGVPLLPCAEVPTGLHVLLPGGQGEHDPESGPAECQAEHRGDPDLLSG